MTNALCSEAVIPSFGELSPADCERILQNHLVGRLAFTLHDRVNVLPVHYKYSGGWLYGRSAPGGKLLQILRNRWVAFEVDEQQGLFDWQSVVAHGALYIIEPQRSNQERAVYDCALEILRELIPETLDIGDPVPFRNQFFRIHVAELSGRFCMSHGGSAAPPRESCTSIDTADAAADTTLREQVVAVTAPFVHGAPSSLHIDVSDGVVVLGGAVSDPRDRSALEAAVVKLPGVHAVVQQLETNSGDSELGPAEVATRALRALRSPPLPADSDVTVVVDHGWLRVEGSVKSPKERDEIRRRLEYVPGARGFVDRVSVDTVS